MNKKAFTAIEIVIVIVLLAGVIALAILSENNSTDGSASILIPSHELYKNK